MENPREQIDEVPFFEKEPVASSENFEVHYDQEAEENIPEGLESKLEEVKDLVDRMLDLDERTDKTKIYLFSNKEQYQRHIKDHDLPKGEATFDTEAGAILILVGEREKGEFLGGIAHEMAHFNPFFGGVGNDPERSKWEQEMVCNFVGNQIGVEFGDKEINNRKLLVAKEELSRIKKFSWREKEYDWENFLALEVLVYPWLEKRYGMKKLQGLWGKLFKERQNLASSIKDIYKQELPELEREFAADILKAETYKDFME
ncbi:hypothetical protein E3J85_00255 [Patescibacteria group bacterium]|nr:MAG: hypothetical protein E3J85_00255 [Patescibacteria group bacterium]